MAGMKVVGLVERVKISGRCSVEALALLDSGAKQTSIDMKLAAKAQLGPIVGTTKVKNPGVAERMRRPVVRARIRIGGKSFLTEANIQDRSHMSFPVIIGRNILTGNFVIDTKRNYDLYEKMKKTGSKGARSR